LKTCGFVQLADNVDHRPAVSSYHSRVRAALEKGSQKIAMFLALGTPICRQLLEDTVVCKPKNAKWINELRSSWIN
jgi:hypothetical protein